MGVVTGSNISILSIISTLFTTLFTAPFVAPPPALRA